MRQLLILAIPALLTLTGCGPDVTLADDFDIDFDFSLRASDALHAPYVRGAHVRLRARTDDEGTDTSQWSIRSRNPAVLAPLDPAQEHQFLAESAGTAEVQVLDVDDSVLHAAVIEVAVPDRATLQAHAPMFVGRNDPPVGDRVTVLAGGSATFLVRYWQGDRELHGNGVLTAAADATVAVQAQTSFLVENREWLTVTPGEPGDHVVQIFADGVPVGALAVHVVTAEAVEAILLTGQDESQAKAGDALTVLAEAFDLDGNPVYGVDFGWDLDGAPEQGQGDLYTYEYRPSRTRTLCARFNTSEAAATIHAGIGGVGTSNTVGCSTGSAHSPSALALVLTVLAATVLLRRRDSGRVS